jgi:hypothetical protein
MPIKTTLRFHLTFSEYSYHQKHHHQQCWWVSGVKRTLMHFWWECKLVQLLWKILWRVLKKLNIDLPYDPAIPLLLIYPKEYESVYSIGTCTPMFIAVLFT